MKIKIDCDPPRNSRFIMERMIGFANIGLALIILLFSMVVPGYFWLAIASISWMVRQVIMIRRTMKVNDSDLVEIEWCLRECPEVRQYVAKVNAIGRQLKRHEAIAILKHAEHLRAETLRRFMKGFA